MKRSAFAAPYTHTPCYGMRMWGNGWHGMTQQSQRASHATDGWRIYNVLCYNPHTRERAPLSFTVFTVPQQHHCRTGGIKTGPERRLALAAFAHANNVPRHFHHHYTSFLSVIRCAICHRSESPRLCAAAHTRHSRAQQHNFGIFISHACGF